MSQVTRTYKVNLDLCLRTVFTVQTSTVKPILRGHHWDKTKYPFKTGDLLKGVQFI